MLLSSTRLQTSKAAAGSPRVADSQVSAGVLRTVNTAMMTAVRLSSEMTARPQPLPSRNGSSRMTDTWARSRIAEGCLRTVAFHRSHRDGGSRRSSHNIDMATL